jgi:uncharacterized protein YqkB
MEATTNNEALSGKIIHDFLVESCGAACKVKGISAVLLTKLKQGRTNLSIKKIRQIAQENNLKLSYGDDLTIILEFNNNKLIIKL